MRNTFSVPDLVGQVIVMPVSGRIDDRIKTIGRRGTCRKWGEVCPIGLKIPMNYRGRTEVTLGRAARPGEKYDVMAPIGGPGELHCVPYVGRRVRSVGELLRERGVTSLAYSTGGKRRSQVPGDWYVHEGTLTAPDAALLLVGPDRTPRDTGPKTTGDFC
ncbi:hypothetical protein [Spongiactinospora gelatinilytica]|uniref:hypothetical protein n=1 Tax=Spongiactinospora gelatinilytica TaxID=2666298 RepID=UPI0011B9437F|nr:hypothetical protein [Spongiactinospora gelatinilytica]